MEEDLYSLFTVVLVWGLLFMVYNTCKRKRSPNLQLSSPSYPYPSSPKRSNVGCLHVRTGPMFCGKTTWLHREISQRADLLPEPPLLINSNKDTRDEKISSHGSHFKGLSHKIRFIKTTRLSNVDVDKFSVIGIDEAQFYTDLNETVRVWINAGKQVYCAGLDGDFMMNSFGQIHQLLPISDTFIKMSAICDPCLREAEHPIIMESLSKAPFSARVRGSTSQVEVGGADKYVAVCRYHFTVRS